MNQILEKGCRGSLKAARLQTVHCLHFCCPSNNSRPNVPFKGSNASRLLCESQPFLAGAYCLCTFAKRLRCHFALLDNSGQHHERNCSNQQEKLQGQHYIYGCTACERTAPVDGTEDRQEGDKHDRVAGACDSKP